MLVPEPESSLLLLVDFQLRLAPAMDEAAAAIANARRLAEGAALLGVDIVVTEQNPDKLGATVPELAEFAVAPVGKQNFSVIAAPEFPQEMLDGRTAILAGFEAHVCVLQTALGLLHEGRKVFVVADAVASRRAESKDLALRRLAACGADLVTAEMVLFEWLGSADHPKFRDVSRLVK